MFLHSADRTLVADDSRGFFEAVQGFVTRSRNRSPKPGRGLPREMPMELGHGSRRRGRQPFLSSRNETDECP
jgi:hypothetical protein